MRSQRCLRIDFTLSMTLDSMDLGCEKNSCSRQVGGKMIDREVFLHSALHALLPRQLIAIRNLPSRSGGPQAISTHPTSQPKPEPKPEVLRPTRKSALPLIREAGGGGGGAESSARLLGSTAGKSLQPVRNIAPHRGPCLPSLAS
jgi:hypothetical protein